MASLSVILFASKFLSFLSEFCRHIRRRMIAPVSLLIALCSLLEFDYKGIRHAFVGLWDRVESFTLFLTKYCDSVCGSFALWCIPTVFNMFLLFLVVKFSGYCKGRKGLSSIFFKADHFDGVNSFKFKFWSRVSGAEGGDQNTDEIDEVASSNCGFEREKGFDISGNEREEEEETCCDEDQVFDVMSLRKMVKAQRQRANAAELELEKERMAAASSADEAMAMILRLQNDKSALQMQVNQLQRWTEEKELYDEATIQSLEGIIMDHDHEMSLLVDQLRICREKLRTFVKDEEWDEHEFEFDPFSTRKLVKDEDLEWDQFDWVSSSPSGSSSCNGSSLDLGSSPNVSPDTSRKFVTFPANCKWEFN